MTRPTVSSVTNQNASSFLNVDDVVLIGYFGVDDKHLRSQFEDVANTYYDRYSFGIAALPQNEQASLECNNNLDKIQRSTTEFASVNSINFFLKLCSTPLIPELTRRNELSFYEVCDIGPPFRRPCPRYQHQDRAGKA